MGIKKERIKIIIYRLRWWSTDPPSLPSRAQWSEVTKEQGEGIINSILPLTNTPPRIIVFTPRASRVTPLMPLSREGESTIKVPIPLSGTGVHWGLPWGVQWTINTVHNFVNIPPYFPNSRSFLFLLRSWEKLPLDKMLFIVVNQSVCFV